MNRWIAAVAAVLILVLLTACDLFTRNEPSWENDSGAMLVQHGSFVYLIGGFDNEGNPDSTVLRAQLQTSPEGEVLTTTWETALSLPEGRAYGAAFSAGHYLYVIGGEDSEGPVDSIFITKIDPETGQLGYNHAGSDSYFWIEQDITLPEPRSGMGWALYDGRIYLIGGKSDDGNLDTIIHARIWVMKSGRTGNWYESPTELPYGLVDTSAAVLQDRLYILGGRTDHDSLSTLSLSYAISSYGLLSDQKNETRLPDYRSSLLIAPGNDTLVIGGGYDRYGNPAETFWIYESQQWQQFSEGAFSGFSSYARMEGNLVIFDTRAESRNSGTTTTLPTNLPPIKPQVLPGSGYIRGKGTNALTWTGPEEQLYYTESTEGESSEPTVSSQQWNSTETLPLDTSRPTLLNVKSFFPENISQPFSEPESVIVTRTYTPLLLPDFFSDTIAVDYSGGSTMQTFDLTDSLLDGTVYTVDHALYRILLNRPVLVQIDWHDTDSSSAYTTAADFTLLEEDYYTQVITVDGKPVASTSLLDGNSDTELGYGTPCMVKLQKGLYYLYVTEQDVVPGGTFGFHFKVIDDDL